MPAKDKLLALVVVLIWGVNFVAADLVMEDVPPLMFAALRFALVAIPAVFLVKPPGNGWRAVAASGATLCVGQFGLLYTAMHLGMPAGLASLVLQVQSVFTVIIAALVLREHPTRTQVLGIGIGVLGMAVIAARFISSAPALPFLLTIAAALAWGSGNVITRRNPPRSGFSLVVWSALVAPVPLFLASLLLEGWDADRHGLAHVGWTAVGGFAFVSYGASMVGYGLWNKLLSRHAAATVAPWSMFVPVVGTVAAYFYDGEVPTLVNIIGAVIVIVGVLLALGLSPRRRTPAVPDRPDVEHPPVDPAGL